MLYVKKAKGFHFRRFVVVDANVGGLHARAFTALGAVKKRNHIWRQRNA